MRNQRLPLLLLLGVALIVWPVFAQNNNQTQSNPGTQPATSDQNQTTAPQTPQEQPSATQDTTTKNEKPAKTERIESGRKEKVSGVIIKRDSDSMIVRTDNGSDMMVKLSNSTKVEEKKSNPFRGAHKYPATDLMHGLNIEAEGRGDGSGALMADKIRFTPEALATARSVESRVTPVEGRVQSAETRLGENEQNAQRMSGQIEELSAVSNAARGGARAAQQTADQAVAGVGAANQRISDLDNYEARQAITVHFKVGSAVLSPEAKKDLDQIADQAKGEKGYIIEVAGFASSDGNEALNERLSRLRADAVVSYLVQEHDIPQHRIITPLGYGTKKPVADNHTRDGRKENRRVEVKMLVNKGLTTSAENPASSSNTVPR